MSSPVARFSITNLEPGAQYQAVLYSYNSKGRSEPVILQAATLRLPEKQLTAEKDTHRSSFRFTPTMSVLIGVVSALLIVALVVILVLRLQCSRNDERKNRQKISTSSVSDRRGSGSIVALSDKGGGGSPISKHDSSAGECDSDEKNPDIIPQPVDCEDVDYVRKRQHISTIETSSPTRSLLQGNTGYMPGYCTLRNGLPVQNKIISGPSPMLPPYSSCSLPRPQWQYGPMSHLPPGVYPTMTYRGTGHPQRSRAAPREPPIALQPMNNTVEEEPNVETPLMGVNKRESTV